MPQHREVTPIIDLIRRFCRGKMITCYVRYADTISARTQPQPNLPDGPYHKTSQIYYFTRDGRREVQPPVEIPLDKQITSGNLTKAVEKKYITPGNVFKW